MAKWRLDFYAQLWSIAWLAAAVFLAPSARASEAGQTTIGYWARATSAGIEIGIGAPTTDPAPFRRKFHLSDVAVEGCMPNARAAVNSLIASRRGQDLTVADVFQLAQSIETAHHQAGYFLARVVVPDQIIRRAAHLRLKVVDVRLQDVAADGMPASMTRRIAELAAPIREKPMPTNLDLARLLGRAQYEFARDLHTDPIETPRSDRLKLLVSGPARSITSEASASSFASRAFNAATAGATSAEYGLLGQGERISIGGLWSLEKQNPATNGSMSSFAATGALPNNLFGGAVLEFGASRTLASFKTPDSSAIAYTATRATLLETIPLFLKGDESLLFRFGGEFVSEHESLSYTFDDGTFANAEIPYTTVDAQASATWLKTVQQIKLELGADAAFGASRTIDPSSYAAWTRSIGMVKGHAKLDAPIWFGAVFYLSARAYASVLAPLPPGAQNALLQSAAIAPIDPRAIEGDNGASGRAEISRNFPQEAFGWQFKIEPYSFAAIGFLVERSTLLSTAHLIHGGAAGAGLRFSFPAQRNGLPALEATVELSRQQTNSVTTPDYSALVISMKARF